MQDAGAAGALTPAAGFHRLLVPIDGSELDERSFGVSITLARQLRATIVGLIVEPFAGSGRPALGAPGTPDPVTEPALRAHAHAALNRFEHRVRHAEVPFEGVAAQSRQVSAAIIDAAREHGCDMIVMATHGRGVMGELLWGSHTREVMSRSEVPVLVLSAAAKEAPGRPKPA